MGDTPQIDWQNDPAFHNLPLAEKHKVLLQIDPDYKGLPAKEQAKALDAIHYGSLGQISGTGELTKGAGTEIWNTLKGMVPPPPEGTPLGSPSKFFFGSPSYDPSKSGIAQVGREVSHEYQRARQGGAGPLAAGFSGGIAGTASALPGVGLSNIEQEKMAEQGESGKILGQSIVPAAMAAFSPLLEKPMARYGMPRVEKSSAAKTPTAPLFKLSPADALHPKIALMKVLANKAAKSVGYGTSIPTEPTPFPGATSTRIGDMPAAPPETVSIAGTPVRTTPFAELPPVPKSEPTPFPRVMTKAELNAQARAAAAQAKAAAKAKPSPFGPTATSSSAVSPESFVPQESRNLTPFQPITEGTTTRTAPYTEVPGITAPRQVAAPPPAAEGSPQDLITRTKPLVRPGEAPTAAELKRAGDLTQVPLAQLKILAKFGDKLAQNELVRRLRQ